MLGCGPIILTRRIAAMNQLAELFCGYTMIVWFLERLLIVLF